MKNIEPQLVAVKSWPTASDGNIVRDRITQLDGWRGVSILLVVIGHVINWRYEGFGAESHRIALPFLLAQWGVDFFFVISGFVITKGALVELSRTGMFSAKAFYLRRFFRIVPPFFSYLLITIGLTYAGLISNQPAQTLVAATFTCNFNSVDCGWFAGHTWTLAYEEQFYLLFPMLFALFTGRIRPVFLGIFIFLLFAPFLRVLLGLGEHAQGFVDACKNFVFIAAGVAMAAYEPLLKRVAIGSMGKPLTYCALVGLVCLAFLLTLAPMSAAFANTQKILRTILVPLCILWLIGSSIYQDGWMIGILKSAPLQFVGMISYSLYLWQQLFTANDQLYLTSSALQFPLLMFVAAALSYYLIERPCIRLGRSLAARRTPVKIDSQ